MIQNSLSIDSREVFTYQVSASEKLQALSLPKEIADKLTPYLDEPFSKLRARSNYWKLNPKDPSSDNAWLGLLTLPPIRPLDMLNHEDSAQEAKAFNENRRRAVNAKLQLAPFVFLAGFSGVGKTSFVTKFFCEQDKDTLHILKNVDEDILAWIKDKTPNQRKLLFIDESNLHNTDWTMFEGLFQESPSNFIQGQAL